MTQVNGMLEVIFQVFGLHIWIKVLGCDQALLVPCL